MILKIYEVKLIKKSKYNTDNADIIECYKFENEAFERYNELLCVEYIKIMNKFPTNKLTLSGSKSKTDFINKIKELYINYELILIVYFYCPVVKKVGENVIIQNKI